MVRLESVKKGARGVVVATAQGGSLFRFKPRYLSGSQDGGEQASGGDAEPGPGSEYPEDALLAAVQATDAEEKALALLARAEQTRAGLARKLGAKRFPSEAVDAALDELEGAGLLSDRRFALSWARQRSRSRAEGPVSLRAGLAARGVGRADIQAALDELYADEGRAEAVSRALALLIKRHSPADARIAMRELGWKSVDIDDAFDRITGD
ncbi:MAG: regulatory protein RecX [Spirochaetales bacterium]|nr:regulatory protein RecX [Spirochaetales bacterium]MBP7262875.1 regulatory protein RecX [Spirochaetia bacterium]